MFRIQEKTAAKETKREAYLQRVLGEPDTSLIDKDADEQKKKFQQEVERLGELVSEVSSSAQVTGDCNGILDEVCTLIKGDSPDKCTVLSKFEKIKQRLIRAYDSRESLPWWFPFIIIFNIAVLGALVAVISVFALVPGQKNLESTGFVLLACALWGGVGGIVDAFFALHTHFANQDFDKQYLPWYLLHPILGISMGAVIFLVLQAGLLAISGTSLQEAASSNTTAAAAAETTGKAGSVALPIAIAFLTGFKQNTAVNFLTRTVTAIFQSNPTKESESGK